MATLDDDDLLLDGEEQARPPTKQTRALGRKQCATHWLPEPVDERGVLAAGSWDDAENIVALWTVALTRDDGGADVAMLDEPDDAEDEPLATAPHEGCVLDMAAGGAPGTPTLLFTGSGAGGVSCFAVEGGCALAPRWRERAEAHRQSAVHGVCFDAETHQLAAASDDGALALLDVHEGRRTRELPTHETALLDVCCQQPKTVVAAGSRLQLYDVRAGGATAQLVAAVGTAVHRAPQLLCVAAHPQRTHMLAAGTSDGDVLLWDTRRADKGAMGRLEQALRPPSPHTPPTLALSLSFLSPLLPLLFPSSSPRPPQSCLLSLPAMCLPLPSLLTRPLPMRYVCLPPRPAPSPPSTARACEQAHSLYGRNQQRVGADVLGVQFCQTAYGELLSCARQRSKRVAVRLDARPFLPFLPSGRGRGASPRLARWRAPPSPAAQKGRSAPAVAGVPCRLHLHPSASCVVWRAHSRLPLFSQVRRRRLGAVLVRARGRRARAAPPRLVAHADQLDAPLLARHARRRLRRGDPHLHRHAALRGGASDSGR